MRVVTLRTCTRWALVFLVVTLIFKGLPSFLIIVTCTGSDDSGAVLVAGMRSGRAG